ncbi:MAG: aminotransferase class I/II-fold pyridoxal phosphate-dependent enzyme [Rectinemataceae bacterium]
MIGNAMSFFQPFRLERFFAEHEFGARYLLCSSDCETIETRELLAMEEGAADGFLAQRLGYTETRGDPRLREDIARLYRGIGADDILVHAGAEEAILNLCLAILSAGDHVVVDTPCYQSLAEIPRARGCAVTPWPLHGESGRWVLDPEELGRLLRPRTRLVVLNMPHNPTGALLTRGEFDRTVELCRGAGALLFVDEVYRHLETDPERRLPAACEAYENGVSLNVLSKSAGLAGLRIGWLATKRADILDAVAAVKDYNSICSSAPSEFLAGLAVRSFDRLVERSRAIVASNLALLRPFFSRHGDFLRWNEPEGGSIAFPRFVGPGAADKPDAGALAQRILEDSGVLLLPGACYGYEKEHFRIGFGRANLPEALDAFEAWIEKKT